MKCFIAFLLATTSALAQLTFQKSEIELTATPDQQSLNFDFSYSNQTANPIQIRGIDPHCSCVTAAASINTVAPGATGTIRLILDAKNLVGTITKSAEISFHSSEKSQTITIKANLPEIVKPDTRSLQWTYDEERKAKTIRISIAQDHPTKILKITPSNQSFQVEWRTIEDKKSYEITVTPPLEKNSTAVLGLLKIQTDSPFPRHQNLECYLLVRPKDR